MINTLKKDLPASIVVFLVALPLCLGIALASGAPLLSGVISGIIGGIVVGMLSKSHTSVSGPAAGLTAVVLAAITQLGSFDVFLAAVLIAGVIQIGLGLAKAGFIAQYVPSNVIKGLLAAIGVILILKQIPHAIGFDRGYTDDVSLLQPDGINSISEILSALHVITPGAVIVSILSILILIFWDKTPLKKATFFPASLCVVVLGVMANFLFQKWAPLLTIPSEHLVAIPKIGMESIAGLLHLPVLTYFINPQVWMVAFTLAAVASLETLLNIEAVDKIDPHKRETPQNRELVAQGVGNVCAGLLGGIPVTSVIVRSSVNIQSGNETKLSAILHGIFMLISVLALSPLLNHIPLAALAAILIVTGYKLAKVAIFKDMYQKGWAQFVPFVATILAIVFTDLLIGVGIGLCVGIFYLLRSNFQNPFVKENVSLHIGEMVRLELPNQVSFLNKASIKDTLWAIPDNTKVVIDASNSDFIDNDVLEIIDDYKTVVAPEKNIQLNILGLKNKYQLTDHIQFLNVLDKDTVAKLTPARILELLKEGNDRFVNGKWTDKYLLHQINATSLGQNPMAVIVGCIDSRTSPEILFDAGIGDLLTVRIAGNIINPEIVGSLEIAVKKLGAKLIVVKGHSNCGAVALSLANVMDDTMHTITSKIQQVAIQNGYYPKPEKLEEATITENVTKLNAQNSVNEILAQSPYLKSKVDQKEIGIVSAYHDLSVGKVHFEELV